MMRLFLTGGTGFIGSHFLAAAIRSGHEVLALRRRAEAHPVIDPPVQPQWVEGECAGINRSVAAGTCHEYGASAEEYEAIPANAPLQPLSLYAASKAAAYELLHGYVRVHGMELF